MSDLSAELDQIEYERDDALAEVELLQRDLDANIRLMEAKDETIAELKAEIEFLKRQLGVLD